jgi:hypothetical protein
MWLAVLRKHLAAPKQLELKLNFVTRSTVPLVKRFTCRARTERTAVTHPRSGLWPPVRCPCRRPACPGRRCHQQTPQNGARRTPRSSDCKGSRSSSSSSRVSGVVQHRQCGQQPAANSKLARRGMQDTLWHSCNSKPASSKSNSSSTTAAAAAGGGLYWFHHADNSAMSSSGCQARKTSLVVAT